MAEARQLVERVGTLLPEVDVSAGYLELAEPPVLEAIGRAVERGVKQLTVAPLLLLAAGHAQRDIPALITEAAARWPHVRWKLAQHLGMHEGLLQLSQMRYREAVDSAEQPLDADPLLLVVGRGSTDQAAIAELNQYARRLAERLSVDRLECCFLAMAEPPLEAGLERAAASGARSVVILPHLLLQGDLLQRLAAQVAHARGRWPNQQWLLAGHLGPDRLLAEVVASRAGGAMPYRVEVAG